ncbi:amino acid adenylation domain-containing protein [Paenibacillus sp. GCM10027627]
MNRTNELTESYWLKELAGPLPRLELPSDKVPETNGSYKEGVVTTNAGNERMKRLEAYVKQQHTTEQTFLMSCQFVLLHKLTGDRDLIIGNSLALGDSEDMTDSSGTVPNGLVLPIRVGLDNEGMTFYELLRQTEEKDLQGLFNIPFLNEEPDSRFGAGQDGGPEDVLYSSLFRYTDSSPPQHVSYGSPLPLGLNFVKDDSDIKLRAVYNASLFLEETIQSYLRYYFHIVDQVLDNPAIDLASIGLLAERDVEEGLLASFGSQTEDEAVGLTAHEQFERQVRLAPDAPALVFNGQTMTYLELNARANKLARTLRLGGVAPDQMVVLIADRSPDLLVGILAVLKAGGAYLAIDPEFPEERKQYMLEDCGCRLLLTQRELKGNIEAERVWYLDEESTYHEDDSDLDPVVGADNLAYVIYTSGSTGRPKGIMIEHRGLTHFFAGFAAQLPLERGQRILGLATVSFDIFIVETLLPLSLGMTIVLASEEEKNDPSRLSGLLADEQVDVLQLTPSRFKWWSAQTGAAKAFERLSLLMIGAEPLAPSLWRMLKACLSPSARIFNLYGPTETTVWASVQEVTEEKHPITIGKGIAGAAFLAMNSDGQLQPDGVPGELYIGGVGLGRGYMNRPDLTEAAFVEHRFARGGKLYRTGDIVKKLPSGEFLYMGRKDFQVKIRGFRIELGEIEQVLLGFPGIREAVVHTIPVTGQDELALCGYLVGEQPDAGKLRHYLADRLPAYMIPSYLMSLDAIPLTPTGKVDRKSLPDPTKQSAAMLQDSSFEGEQEGGPQNERESVLFDAWEKFLGHRSFHRNQSLFDAGGNSIMIIRVCSELEQEGWQLEVADMFRALTIAGAAPLMKRMVSEFKELRLLSGTVEGKVELVSQQQAFVEKAWACTGGREYDTKIIYRPGGFDYFKLRLVLGRLMERHDALRIIYYSNEKEVIQFNRGMFSPLFKLDVSSLLHAERSINVPYMVQLLEEAKRRRGRFSELRLEAYLFKGEAGDYLALMADPLVMDGTSWTIFIDDLLSACKQAEDSTDIHLPAKANSFQLYAKIIEAQGSGMKRQRDGMPQHTESYRHTVHLGEELSELLFSSFDGDKVEGLLTHSLLQASAEEWSNEQAHLRLDGRGVIDSPGLDFNWTIGRMDQVLTVDLSHYQFEPDRLLSDIGLNVEQETQYSEEAAAPRILVRMDRLVAMLPDMEMLHDYRQPTGYYPIEASFGRSGAQLYVAFDYAVGEDLIQIKRLADIALNRVREVVGWLEKATI